MSRKGLRAAQPSGISRWVQLGVLVVALFAASIALIQLIGHSAGIERWDTYVDETPVSVYTPRDQEQSAPVVLIAHGFAGSRPMMEPFALTLAGNGYVAVTFDYLGHGRHPQPLYGELREWDGAPRVLLEQTEQVAAFVRQLEQSDGRMSVLGHSMASNLMARYAQIHPEVDAHIGVSQFAPKIDADSPSNVLTVVGGWEGRLEAEGRRVVAMVTDLDPAQIDPGTTYGSFEDGTARRLAVIPGIEHVSILYSARSHDEVRRWLDHVYERSGGGFVATRGPWLMLLLAALLLLARSLAPLLPVVAEPARGAGLGWSRLLILSGGAALLTPLLLLPLPTNFLPVVVGDYLAVHFALYGLLTTLGLWWLAGRPAPLTALRELVAPNPGRLLAAAVLLVGFCLVLLGAVFDRFLLSFYPSVERLPLLLAMFFGVLPYFLADEWLTRGNQARSGAYPLTKLFFLLSLALAVALDREALFFLLMIVPVTVLFFIFYGLFSRWAYRRTGHPWVAAMANAVAFAWALAVTFPMFAGPSPGGP